MCKAQSDQSKKIWREKKLYEMVDETNQIFSNEFLKDFKFNTDSYQEKFLHVFPDKSRAIASANITIAVNGKFCGAGKINQ